MAEIRPFRGLRYNLATVGDLAGAVCPPYDIVSAAEEESLVRRNKYNAVRLELRERHPGEPQDEDRYSRASDFFQQWLDQGVLAAEPLPAMYLVEEEFAHQGDARRRQGLVAVVRLEEFEKGIVMPHEFTRPGPKADRLALMKACRTNFSPIMSLYRDSDGDLAALLARARQGQPHATAVPQGQPEYRLWVITDPDILEAIQVAMASRQVFVADGHHRYETALKYRDHLEATEGPLPHDAAARFMMMTLISMDAPGLVVLPYHRLLAGLDQDELGALYAGLERSFQVETIDMSSGQGRAGVVARELENWLSGQSKDEVVVAALGLEPEKAHLLTLRDTYKPAQDAPSLERCDMWLLHEKGIRPALGEGRENTAISFVHDATEAVESVLDSRADVAFLLRPLPMDLFEEVVGKGERLPSKSTYFYPKLPTGLVINDLSGEL